MSNPLKSLSLIQKIDITIKAIEDEAAAYKDRILELESTLDGKTGEKEENSTELDGLTSTKKELEEKIRVNKEKIAKDESRLNQIQNDKEYKALTKEISTAKQTIKLTEMELDALASKIEGKEGEVNASEGDLGSTKEEIEKLRTELEENTKEWEKVLSEKNSERDAVVKEVSSSVLKRYDAIRSRRAGLGLVQVVDEICQGCYINIPPQVYIQLQKKENEEIFECPHCHRMVYFEGEES